VSVHSADCDWLPIDAEQACSREKRSSFSAFSGGYVCPEPVLADGHFSPENSSVQSHHDPKRRFFPEISAPSLISDLRNPTLRKTAFLSHLYIKMIILPRQARDKHRENSKNAVVRTETPPSEQSCRSKPRRALQETATLV
jgi:hypothetical protein